MDRDPLLRRLERSSAIACVVLTAAAVVVSRGRPAAAAAAVVGGWLLTAIGYRAIVAAVDALIVGIGVPGTAVDRVARRRQVIGAAVKMSGRYALLAVLAYVMIARLRLPPLGILAGASSAVAAVSVEAFRLLVKKT